MVRFTPQKPACHSNHRSTHANQTEARYRQPPRQMGMASHVNRRRGADSLPESLTRSEGESAGVPRTTTRQALRFTFQFFALNYGSHGFSTELAKWMQR